MRRSMLLLLIVVATIRIEPASAGAEFVEVRRPGDAFVVCNRRGCWWEPGTGYRFNRLFGVPRAVTAVLHGEAVVVERRYRGHRAGYLVRRR